MFSEILFPFSALRLIWLSESPIGYSKIRVSIGDSLISRVHKKFRKCKNRFKLTAVFALLVWCLKVLD